MLLHRLVGLVRNAISHQPANMADLQSSKYSVRVRYCSTVALTTLRYPDVKRKNFAKLYESDINVFESIVGNANVLRSDLDVYNTDWLRTCRVRSKHGEREDNYTVFMFQIGWGTDNLGPLFLAGDSSNVISAFDTELTSVAWFSHDLTEKVEVQARVYFVLDGIFANSGVVAALITIPVQPHCNYIIDASTHSQSEVVLRPSSVEEVSAILKYCNEKNIALNPQGGNTGLVGGSVPVFDEVILSISRMNQVINIDKTAGVLTCEAGCVLETLDNNLSTYGLMMPLDLGAKGSCHIGGNISTNAGGIRYLRYGSLHGNVLGLQVVLADGSIINNLNPLPKDNTGYDLKHLFIGAEGTLGVVTAVTLKCPTKPNSVNAALVAVASFEKCLSIYTATKKYAGEILSAFEFMDLESRQVISSNLQLDYPLDDRTPFYILIETSGSDETHDQEKLDRLLQYLMDEDLITNGTISQDHTQLKYMWSLRERLAEALVRDGYTYKYDISIPLNCWYDLVVEFRKRLVGTDAIRCVGYGHLGDGNLHLNITSRDFSSQVANIIEPYIYDWTASRNGSVSAEHGLGFRKRNYIYHSKSRELVNMMKLMKKSLDPRGILNPYTCLPDE